MKNKYEYKIENGNEYEISYYYFKIEEDLFLCKLYQNTEDGSDMDLEIATTRDSYDIEELVIEEDTMVNKEEFKDLYNKLKSSFIINMF